MEEGRARRGGAGLGRRVGGGWEGIGRVGDRIGRRPRSGRPRQHGQGLLVAGEGFLGVHRSSREKTKVEAASFPPGKTDGAEIKEIPGLRKVNSSCPPRITSRR